MAVGGEDRRKGLPSTAPAAEQQRFEGGERGGAGSSSSGGGGGGRHALVLKRDVGDYTGSTTGKGGGRLLTGVAMRMRPTEEEEEEKVAEYCCEFCDLLLPLGMKTLRERRRKPRVSCRHLIEAESDSRANDRATA